jgi:Glucodextranase, domain B
MDLRSGGRPPQVRPRPAPDGRSRRVKPRPSEPSPTRLGQYRRLERRRGLPLVAKLLLGSSIVVLGALILWAGSGGVGPFLASIVRGFGGFVQTVGTAVSSPAPTEAPITSGAPVITTPQQAYVNATTVDVTVTVPKSIAGLPGYTVKLWLTLPDTDPAVVKQAPVGATSVLVIPAVALAKGRNDFQASIVGPGGESELSTVATWVYDNVKPKVQVTSPKNGASVSKAAATIKGTTQADSTVRLVDDINGATATTKAGTDGLWEASIAVGQGVNTITITITDPAGNANTGTLTLRRGSGKLTASLTGTAYRFKASKLPARVSFTVVVTDPGGHRLAGATALFSVTINGLQPIVSGQIRTNASGSATFTMTIPKGAMKGPGLAVVQVTAGGLGSTSDRQVLTVQ